MHKTLGVISLGCSKNLVDTERMLGQLKAAGFTLVQNKHEADILIVNTCGFIESAKQESIDAILELAACKKSGRCKTLVVTGCLVERYREALQKELPEVDVFLGVREYETLSQLLGAPSIQAPRLLATPFYSAYLRIADGCSNRCAYCAIPLIRGGFVSTPMPALLDEAKRLADTGVTELTLIAQDTSGYGVDLYGKPMLMPLLDALSHIDALRFLRVLYTYPDTVTPALISYIAQNEKVCDYLDMPLQHVNDTMLAAMHRRGSKAHIVKVLEHIRTHAPAFMLRTTMMVGFPGETQAQFEELLAFLRAYPFDRLGAFMFSPEEDTPAAAMPMQVDEATKKARLDALMQQQQQLSLARNQGRVGRTVLALIEHTQNGTTYARSYAEAPDVDGRILLPAAAHHTPGAYIQVRLTGALEYDMQGVEP